MAAMIWDAAARRKNFPDRQRDTSGEISMYDFIHSVGSRTSSSFTAGKNIKNIAIQKNYTHIVQLSYFTTDIVRSF